MTSRFPPSQTLAILVLSALSVSVAILSGCNHKTANQELVRPALIFKIAPDSGVETEVYPGEVRSRVEADMAFRIGGKIVARLVDQGATVTKGQPLARLDPQDVKLLADAAQAQMGAAQAEFKFSEAELERFRTLLQKGFISQSAFDTKLNTYRLAKARYESTQAQTAMNRNQTSYATLVADQDGVVTQIMAETGQVVAPGQAIMHVANPAQREVAISVAESKIGQFRNAPHARQLWVTLSSQPGASYLAQVREVGAAADSATRTYPVRISILNADDYVKIGMSANVIFNGPAVENQIAVPLSALYQQGEKTGVWLVGADNHLTFKDVSVVKYRENAALVTGTLRTGDVIVAAGVHKLREGQVVKPVHDSLVTGNGKVVSAKDAAPQAAR